MLRAMRPLLDGTVCSLRAQKLLTDLVQRPGSTAAFPERAPAPGLAGAGTDAGLLCEGQDAISTPRQPPLDKALPDGRGGGGGFPAPPARPRRSETAMAAAPELRESLAQRLRDLGIATVTAEHPQVFTVEEMMPHVQHMKGGHSKNLFLKDKKKKGFWLVTVLHNRFTNPWRTCIFSAPPYP
ncbi:uncharacterized protein LOC115345126 isoform X2 [Aquila chrysaetos chrysaetos]|uniref:uncharacterized protein LOC115345126 isoform X2 n=1 Tax=Aquila chrysaetos chrysaetos TaxID=223781 RepID=UPI001B7D4828|nr:uncharacterized protein LOC115345126 isoform X2 [Aquila chrysaetos chrysaetos]